MARYKAWKAFIQIAAARNTEQPVRRSRWKKLLTASGLLLLVVLCGMALLLFFLKTHSLPVSALGQASKLVDRDGRIIGYFQPQAGVHRQPVGLSSISSQLIHATLAIEDRNFYRHVGFDVKGLARATLVNLEHMQMKQGASTLTQQLARNLYLSQERTWSRKAKEALYTMQLEMKYSKDKILEMYLNHIYYGHGAYGIESAAEMYYGKHAKDLTLAESTMLAGVPKGPTYYSPYNDLKRAKNRQQKVLTDMVDCGYITKEAAAAAYQAPLHFKPLEASQEVEAAPYFRDYVHNIVVNQLGFDESLLARGGVTVVTTLDLAAQQAAEQAIAAQMKSSSPDLQAALVSLDPRNGYVKAMVGGTNYRTNQFNRVFAKTRQPGSSFKPIVYLTALSTNRMTSVTRFRSEPTVFHYDNNRQTYQPSNYGGTYFGEIDMRKAIAASDNIYAVSTLLRVDAANVVEMARKLGIDSPLQPLPSLALGSYPVSPFEMAAAYGVISNQGERVEPVAVLQILDAEGQPVYQAAPPQRTRVTDPAYTYVLTSLMESVFDSGGTGNRVSAVMKRPVAGKTGTTDSDAWLVGFTPELSTAVWVGYDKGKTINSVDAHKAAPIFARFTEAALAHVPPKIFSIPAGVVNVYIDPSTGLLATAECTDKRLEAFVQGTEPTSYCTTHGGKGAAEEMNTNNRMSPGSWWNGVKRWWGSSP